MKALTLFQCTQPQHNKSILASHIWEYNVCVGVFIAYYEPAEAKWRVIEIKKQQQQTNENMNKLVTLWAGGSKIFFALRSRNRHQLDYRLLRSDSISDLNHHGHYDRLVLLLFVEFFAHTTLEIAFELPGIAWRWRS